MQEKIMAIWKDTVETVANICQHNFVNVSNVIRNLTGGWEGWLQVETALSVQANNIFKKNVNFAREQNYPVGSNINGRYDLEIWPVDATGQPHGAPAYLELKAQYPNSQLAASITRYKTDIAKLQNANNNFRQQNILIACVVLMANNQNEVNTLRDEIKYDLNHQNLAVVNISQNQISLVKNINEIVQGNIVLLGAFIP